MLKIIILLFLSQSLHAKMLFEPELIPAIGTEAKQRTTNSDKLHYDHSGFGYGLGLGIKIGMHREILQIFTSYSYSQSRIIVSAHQQEDPVLTGEKYSNTITQQFWGLGLGGKFWVVRPYLIYHFYAAGKMRLAQDLDINPFQVNDRLRGQAYEAGISLIPFPTFSMNLSYRIVDYNQLSNNESNRTLPDAESSWYKNQQGIVSFSFPFQID